MGLVPSNTLAVITPEDLRNMDQMYNQVQHNLNSHISIHSARNPVQFLHVLVLFVVICRFITIKSFGQRKQF